MTKEVYQIGDYVFWDWGEDKAYGTVQKRYTHKTTVTIHGNEVTRDANEDNPAYLIEQNDGDEILKSHSEVRKAA